MNSYTLTLLIKNDIEEADRRALLESITKAIDKIDKEDLWGSKNLSYPIDHEEKAFYAHYEFSSDPKKIDALDKKIKFNEDILRYLLLRA